MTQDLTLQSCYQQELCNNSTYLPGFAKCTAYVSSTCQQIPHMTQENSPMSSAQLQSSIEVLGPLETSSMQTLTETFDPFYMQCDPASMGQGDVDYDCDMDGVGEVGDEDHGDPELRCWEHGCNGRKFSTRSNLIRHQIEKSKARPACKCPQCGAVFSRTSARNQHVAKQSCNRIRRYSNGRERPCPRIID